MNFFWGTLCVIPPPQKYWRSEGKTDGGKATEGTFFWVRQAESETLVFILRLDKSVAKKPPNKAYS